MRLHDTASICVKRFYDVRAADRLGAASDSEKRHDTRRETVRNTDRVWFREPGSNVKDFDTPRVSNVAEASTDLPAEICP